MRNTMKRSIFVVLILILCTYFAHAQQQNNPPVIYRVSNVGFQAATTGTISIIDPLTAKQVREIGLPITSLNIQLTRNQRKAYIAARLPNGLATKGNGALLVSLTENDDSIVPFLTDKVVFRLRLSPDPRGLLWALLGRDNQILLLDPDSLKVMNKIEDVQLPVDVVFNSDGTRAYVLLFNSTILVYDTTKALTPIKIVSLPPNSTFDEQDGDMAISPDDKILCVGSKNIAFIIDTSSYNVIDQITIPVIPFAVDGTLLRFLFHPNRNILYVTESGNLYSYNLSTKELHNFFSASPTVPTIATIQDIKITPDGRLLYVSAFGGRAIIDGANDDLIFMKIDSGFRTQNFAGITLAGDFTLTQAPSLQTTSPAANQEIMSNRPFTITWQTTVAPQSFSLASHKIEISIDGGVTFNVIAGAEQLNPDAQSFTWNVPDIEVAKAQIRVSTVDLGARRASSTTGNFSISKNGGSTADTQPPTVSFISPKGGEKFNSGDTLQITWTSSDNVGVTAQDLSLSTDGGATFPITLASGLSGATQNFIYQIPMSLQSEQTRLRLIVRDGAGNNAQAVTANNFSILLGADTINPTVTISAPNQAQSIIAGQPIQVKWQSTDNRAVVSQALLLSFDNGKTFSQISSFGATENSFVLSNLDKLNFTTPQAMVKITAKDSTGNQGEANSLFTIAPAITMASYQTKVLLINGIGFMSNVNNSIKLFINDREVTLPPNSVNNSSFMVKGNKKKLNIIKGNNTAKLVVDGVSSNSFSFQF